MGRGKSTLLIENLLQRLSEQLTIVIVTHNLFQAQRVARDTVFMARGRVMEYGPTGDIFDHPQKKETRAFLNGLTW